ncbi:MAG: hypothetical protein E7271_09135 [Lachnospiraceae bacterium]|nr:hypothetical protein [Lachnospiraceae bacterium]
MDKCKNIVKKMAMTGISMMMLVFVMVMGVLPLPGVTMEARADEPAYQYKLTFTYGDKTHSVYDESNIDFYDDVIWALVNAADTEYDSSEITDTRYVDVTVSNAGVLSVQQEYDPRWNATYYETILLHSSFTGTQTITLNYHDSQEGYADKTYTFTVTYDGPEMTGCEYIDDSGNVRSALPIALTGNETTLSEGWYVANDNITYAGTIAITGTVDLIIANEKTITVNGSVTGGGSSPKLSIYRRNGTGDLGKLTVQNGVSILNGGLINTGCDMTVTGGINMGTGNAYFYSGEVTVSNTAGDAIYCKNCDVSGGKLRATGGETGYGIRAVPIESYGGGTGLIKLYGGDIEAHGGAGGFSASGRFTDHTKNEGIKIGISNDNDRVLSDSFEGSVFVMQPFVGDGTLYSRGTLLSDAQKTALAGKEIVPAFVGYTLTPVGDDADYITVTLSSGRSMTGEDGKVYYEPGSGVAFDYNRPGYIATGFTVSYPDGSHPEYKKVGTSYTKQANDEIVSFTAVDITSWEGSGTAESPYTISDTDGMNALASLVNNGYDCEGVYFRLEKDLDYSGKTYTPVGYGTIVYSDVYFNGSFNGNNHTISGVTAVTQNEIDQPYGIFGRVGNHGTVSSLTVKNCTFEQPGNEGNMIGAVAGFNIGTITGCFVLDTNLGKTGGAGHVGAVVGNGNGNGANHTGNYYHGCKINGSSVTSGHGIGYYNAASSDIDGGVQPVFTADLGENITAADSAITYGGKSYFTECSTVTLSYNGTPPEGKTFGTFIVKDTSDNDVTVTNNSFTMPALNVTVSAKICNILPSAISVEPLTYNGQNQTDVTVKIGNETLVQDTNYTVVFKQNGQTVTPKNAGNYTAVISGMGDYAGTVEKTLTINPFEAELSWEGDSFTYDGTEKKPTATVTNMFNGDVCTVTVTGGKTNSGENYTATATALSNSNYKLPTSGLTQSFAIAKVDIPNENITAPTAKTDLSYTGSAQALITAGLVTGGTMQYALGSDETTAPTAGWSTAIPTGTNAGTYYVWYKVVGDGNHNDIATASVNNDGVKIALGTSIANAPKATKDDVVYTNKKVGDVLLPAGWSWADTDMNKELTIGTPITATAIYVGEDKDYYETQCKKVEVTLTRKACTHPAKKIVKENVVAATCLKDGSYVEVVVCDQCGEEISRETKTEKQSKDVENIAVKEVTVEKKGTFEVTSDATSKTNTVTFTAVANTKAKSVTIPDTVTVDGKKYEVTEVSAEALKNSSATTVTIGKNVTTLAPEAFKGSNVKTITIKSKKLTKQSVKNAFKGLKVKKLIVKVKVGSKKENKKYIKKYKKFFTKKNIGVKAVVK